ncbi:MAG: hypothetical protein WA160_11440 [Pseudobdellovibrio sp.]
MANTVKLSKDGNSIDFVVSENIPASVKKFRHSPEIKGLYTFIFENDLQKEAFAILEGIVAVRKAKKLKEKQDAMPAKKIEAAKVITKKAEPIVQAKPSAKPAIAAKPIAKVEVAKKAAPGKPGAKTILKKSAPVKPVAKKK